jgi:hypothetical protein
MSRTWFLLVLCAGMAVSLAACSNEVPPPAADPGRGGTDYTEAREPCSQHNPSRNVYFGDLHIHTALSFDAWIWDVRTTPADAYRFARGEPIPLTHLEEGGQGTRTIRLERPLDFAAVTDHAEFFAEVDACVTPGSDAYDALTCVLFRRGDFLSTIAMANQLYLTNPKRPNEICGPGRVDCPALAGSVWAEIQEAARDAYDQTSDCSFTTFVGYEYTGVPGISNYHRNVIFRNANVPEQAVSYVDQPTLYGLWTELEQTCLEDTEGCDVLAIPHNSNESNGNVFFPRYPGAETIDEERELAALRGRAEPLVEVFQHKGDMECMNGLAGVLGEPDELCNFEKIRSPDSPDCGEGTGALGAIYLGCVSKLDFVRNVLLEGLKEEERLGVNPYRLGILASTDTHNATGGAVAEDRYVGHHGNQDDDPQKRSEAGKIVNNPGGLAAVWAVENSRDAIFEALKRREIFGTSGPRMVVRLFGGWDYPEGLCEASDFVERGYEQGSPMGGDLPPRPQGAVAPRFAVLAMREADFGQSAGTPLQRLQIIKGWLNLDGEPIQKVFDVAGDPNNGASVNLDTCEATGEGFDTLCTVWSDPEFDPRERAFYYARVVENPTCRWSTYDCIRLPMEERPDHCGDPGIDKTIQERAWTSPIWYQPVAR